MIVYLSKSLLLEEKVAELSRGRMWWSAKQKRDFDGCCAPYTTSVICSFLSNASFSSRRSLSLPSTIYRSIDTEPVVSETQRTKASLA